MEKKIGTLYLKSYEKYTLLNGKVKEKYELADDEKCENKIATIEFNTQTKEAILTECDNLTAEQSHDIASFMAKLEEGEE